MYTLAVLSILVVNWNTRDLLRACLKSIFAFSPEIPFEVIVVDNDSKDNSADMVTKEFPSVVLVASNKNTGYAGGNNLAFQRANGSYLLTLNPDTEFTDDSLQRAIDVMEANPTIGCLGIKQIGIDGRIQRSVRGFPTPLGIFGDVSKLGPRLGGILDSYRKSQFDYEKFQRAEQPMGTFLLFRRTALEAVGDAKRPMDPAFPIFFNEVDLLYRLNLAGWPCYYTPDAQVKHYGGESTKQVRKSMIWESHRSLVRYLRKHSGTGIQKVGLPFLFAVIYVAAFIRARGFDAGFRP